MAQSLVTEKLTLSYGTTTIIDELSVAIPMNKITVLIGANGCGKSTLLRSVARLLKPKNGAVLLDGEDVFHLSTKEVAKKLSILPQSPVAPEGLTVLQLVKQGRYPHQTWRKQWTEQDEKIVMDALKSTGMYDLQHKIVDELSGGQRQRAWIAMTLAQYTDIILLDEPTTYLDLTHQIDVLDLLFDLNRTQQRTIIMVLHDINLACRYADHIITVKDRTIFEQGKPEDIMTAELVENVFDLKCQMMTDPLFGTPMCLPFGKGRVIQQLNKV